MIIYIMFIMVIMIIMSIVIAIICIHIHLYPAPSLAWSWFATPVVGVDGCDCWLMESQSSPVVLNCMVFARNSTNRGNKRQIWKGSSLLMCQ